MSTGTNKERIEQNNTLLEEIKVQIQNLPEADSGNSKIDMSHYIDASTTSTSCNIWRYITEIRNIDASNIIDMSFMFADCSNLVTVEGLNICNATTLSRTFIRCTSLVNIRDLDTSSVTTMGYAFSGCTSLTEMPLLNTSSVTTMGSMLKGCTNLVTIPQLDTTSVTAMGSAFSECASLSEESLNNILSMCASATNYTATKTLAAIGLSEEQATKCTTLSNYEAFTAAGWTTGY